MIAKLQQHPLRQQLAAEIHARPVPPVDGPVTLLYLAFMKDLEDPAAPREHLASFLDDIGAPPLGTGAACYYQGLEGGELRWESHQEFCSYLLILPQASTENFPELRLPDWWIQLKAGVPGQLINGIRLEMRSGDTPDQPLTLLPEHFGSRWVYGSRIVDGAASAWSSFTQDPEGLTRYLVFNHGLSAFQAGRTCQRLLESDTYRMVALLGFPLAREVWPEIHDADRALGELTGEISERAEAEGDQAILEQISALSTRIERLRARTSFRFSASRAYAEISLRRLADLREVRWEGTSSLAKFTERRFLPAMQTCGAADRHLRELSQRIGQATALLRTRVELNQEMQNQKLLDAISRRAELQLRLQSVVEGLSVIAITYYLVGLVKVVVEGGKVFPGWTALPGARAAGIAALAGAVSLYLRHRKNRLFKEAP
jgi:uncharacterized membrane-anchored protein